MDPDTNYVVQVQMEPQGSRLQLGKFCKWSQNGGPDYLN
jgi:hypothetical protein